MRQAFFPMHLGLKTNANLKSDVYLAERSLWRFLMADWAKRADRCLCYGELDTVSCRGRSKVLQRALPDLCTVRSRFSVTYPRMTHVAPTKEHWHISNPGDTPDMKI